MLSISSLSVRLDFTTPVDFPYWMGSTFRGGFGVHLRRACCPDVDRDCYECNEKGECIFYHSHMKKTSKRGESAPPKPLVLVPPFFGRTMFVEEEGYLDLETLLFGEFTRYLPHLVLGLRMLGQAGIGSKRRYDMNRFVVAHIDCGFSDERVYDGKTIDLESMLVKDIMDVEPIKPDESITIGFKTPFIYKTGDFPPSLERLVWHIRQRLIYYVNEYGDGSQVPSFTANGEVIDSNEHFHKLKRRSRRGGKQEFYGYTGVVDYRVEEVDETGWWLLGVGELLGGGPKASFGCGHIDIK